MVACSWRSRWSRSEETRGQCAAPEERAARWERREAPEVEENGEQRGGGEGQRGGGSGEGGQTTTKTTRTLVRLLRGVLGHQISGYQLIMQEQEKGGDGRLPTNQSKNL